MKTINATEVRKNWSAMLDSVVHDRPVYVKRTHDNIAMINLDLLREVLSAYTFTADKYTEKDGSITLSAVNLDLATNGKTEALAKKALASEIKEYAEDFYNEFALWSSAPNRKPHIPYVLKALSLTSEQLEEEIVCRVGKS